MIKTGSHGAENLFNFTFLKVDFDKVLCFAFTFDLCGLFCLLSVTRKQ